jgi:hypothetical protein
MATSTRTAKERKRRTVAAGLVQGQPMEVVALEAGCGKRHAQRLAAEPETRFLIADLMRPHHERLRMLIPKMLRAIERGLVAQKTTRSDLPVQLIAARRAKDFLLLAQGPAKTAEQAATRETTWEEFMISYRKHTSTESDS